MQEVFSKIIEELEIERTTANNTFVKYEMNVDLGRVFGLERAIEIVKQEAEKFGTDINVGGNGWIPCSERLPDDFMSFEYLTIRKGHTLATITYYCVVNHKWYLSRNSSKEIDVIAWQPLPEPYKEK